MQFLGWALFSSPLWGSLLVVAFALGWVNALIVAGITAGVLLVMLLGMAIVDRYR